MFCSRCSARVRPIVAIDIDGTLADYYGHLWGFARQYLGISNDHVSAYDGSEPHREWFCRNYKVHTQVFRDIKLAFRSGSMKRSMPPFLPWIQIVKKVNELTNAEVWVTTTRPYLRMDNVDPDTRFWLDRWEVPYDFLLYDETKYQELAHRVDRKRVVAVLDDVDEMYDDAEAMFGFDVPLLRRGESNRAVERRNVVTSPQEAWMEIKSRIEEYERNYG